jgi:2-oxoglutarate dehydrogenase E2 component (dihydrolipoamide succinyltransferase)
MAVDIKIPALGESVTEGTISRWLKKDGETVRTDEPILELETDKATGELPAPATGVLRIAVAEGQSIAIGTVVGRIEPVKTGVIPNDREKPAAPAAKTKDSLVRPGPRNSPKASQRPTRAEATLSPSARRLAREADIDLDTLSGSGPHGLVTKDDIRAYLEQRKPENLASAEGQTTPEAEKEVPIAAPGSGGETRKRMSAIRQRIAHRLVASQQSTATLTTFNEVDMSEVLACRQRYKQLFQEKHSVSLGLMPFFVRASVDALRAFPNINARINGADIVYHHYFHIGIAVATERGLMVPVLRDADHLSFADIEKRMADLVANAREGKIRVEDLQGGTFTITNGGVFGSLLSTPILNPPQAAILGMHAIQRRPVAVDDQVVIRPMMYLALSYDHRLVDGREAVLFLIRVKECIENPERLLLEI